MKRGITLFMLCILSIGANAQTISTPFNYQSESVQITVSPYSVTLWGAMPHTMKATISYHMVEVVYMYNFKAIKYSYQGGGIVEQRSWIGVFILPLQFDYNNLNLSVGAGYFFQPFPSRDGQSINLTLQLSYMLTETIGLSYQHISNGFGITNPFNPGIDNIGLVIDL